jgi:acyl transferase domain-containing protein/acyl carrier protein
MNDMGFSPQIVKQGTQVSSERGVAVIGLRGRFPGAADVEQFWENLRNGVESISFFNKEELALAGVDPVALSYPGFVPAGAMLADVDMFDAQFFGFNARDAEVTDPQQRLFLECAWEAMEVAGYDAEQYPGAVGIFAGCDMSTYMYNIWSNIEQLGFVDGMQLAVGNDKDHLTTHASYKMNLRGPSVCVQTACSTSLVAVSLAVQSLLSGESDLALAGGVAVNVPQRKGYMYQAGGIVSPDGHCRTFDASATGTVIGSGIGLVVLKRLSDALRDRDHIHAVITGAALNNDGSAKVGYHAPSIEGQAQCILMAQHMAGVDPETIGYIEAHGTATALGDPIEIAALTQAFRQKTNRRQFCAIGSVKSNMGHLASAAGIAGLIKAVLTVEHGEIPPSLHYTRPNPQIDFPSTPFFVNTALKPWLTDKAAPRRAGVSSFGIGGTNVHVVLEQPPPPGESGPGRDWQPLILSARSANALDRATDNLADWLRKHPNAALADVAFVHATGRKSFAHRRGLVIPTDDVGQAVQLLDGHNGQRVTSGVPEAHNRPVAFMFPGQGTQFPGMARGLYRTERSFRASVDYCAELLSPCLRVDLRRLLFPPPGEEKVADQRLSQTAVTQPALFTISYATATLWIEWGVVPAAMIGHSIGEWVAACLAGVVSLEEALVLVAARGRLMNRMPPGAMLSVPLSETEIEQWLDSDLSVAALNASSMSVVSGPRASVEALAKRLAEAGVLTRTLHTSHAFHSSMMDPIIPEFVAYVREAKLKPPKIPFVSNVTGTWILPEQAIDPDYWGRHLRSAVRFGAGIEQISRASDHIWLESGPGQTLTSLARQTIGSSNPIMLTSLPGVHDKEPDEARMLGSAVRLWVAGHQIDWKAVYRHELRRRLPLPTYPFERQSYWIGPSERPVAEIAAAAAASASEIAEWFYLPSWTPRAHTPLPRQIQPVNWLIFDDGSGLGARLAERLIADGNTVVRVEAGEDYDASNPHKVRVRPDHAADYDALFGALKQRGILPRRVAHLWLVPEVAVADDGIAVFNRLQPLGFLSLAYLAQAISKTGGADPTVLGIVGTQLAAPMGDEQLSPAKSPALGIAKAIPQEMTSVSCRVIDILPDQVRDERTLERIIGELAVEPFEPCVALRKGRRWVQSYEKTRLDAPTDAAPRLREHGVYVVTGGLGNIALTLAEKLAETARARLVLIGRSPMPPREEWEQVASDPSSGVLGRRLAKLLSLEAKGAEVLVISADVTDAAAMRDAFSHAKRRFGAVNGVIHGAGNVSSDFTPIAEVTAKVAESHFPPKAAGAYVLRDLLREERPDFVLMLSSLSAVLAGLSLGTYASANAFLDALCAQRMQEGETPWISVNWDAWAFDMGRGAGIEAIRPEDGAEAFLRILDRAPTQIVVSVTPLQARLDKWIYLEGINAKSAAVAGKPALHARPNLASQFVASRTETEKVVAGVWEHLIGVAPIGINDRFFELGGHSLVAIQVVARLKDHFRMEIPVQKLFEAPTVAEMASWIDKQRDTQPAEVDAGSLAEILSAVEKLSDEEVSRLLEKQDA